MYLLLCDSEKGDLRMLPYPGSLVEQPKITMNILGIIQAAYREVAAEKVKKMTQKQKASPSRTRRPR